MGLSKMGLVAIAAYFLLESALAACLAVALIASRRPAPGAAPRHAAWVSGSVLALTCAIGLSYLLAPGFMDYGEPVIPILARNLLNGSTVYADPRGGGDLVGTNYGPAVLLFQMPGLWLRAGAFGAKLPGTLAGFGAIGLTYCAARTRGLSRADAGLVTALCAAAFAAQLNRWCWDRPDSYLCLLSAVAAFAAVALEPAAAILLIGLAAGLATDFKAFGAIYVLPAAVCTAARARRVNAIALPAVAAAIAMLALALAPFALRGVSLRAYIANLLLMPHQGYEPGLAWLAASALALMLVAPFSIQSRPAPPREARAFGLGLILAGLTASALAGKPGGGEPYVLPFAPAAAVLCALRWPVAPASAPESRRAAQVVQIVLVCAAVFALPCAAFGAWKLLDQAEDPAAAASALREARTLAVSHPEAEFTYPDGPAERLFLRAERAYSGASARFDYVNYIDQRVAGLPSSRIRPLFSRCAVPSWISIAGRAPWSGRDWRGQLLVEPPEADLFARTYVRAFAGRAFDLWTCRSAAAPSPARIAK